MVRSARSLASHRPWPTQATSGCMRTRVGGPTLQDCACCARTPAASPWALRGGRAGWMACRLGHQGVVAGHPGQRSRHCSTDWRLYAGLGGAHGPFVNDLLRSDCTVSRVRSATFGHGARPRGGRFDGVSTFTSLLISRDICRRTWRLVHVATTCRLRRAAVCGCVPLCAHKTAGWRVVQVVPRHLWLRPWTEKA